MHPPRDAQALAILLRAIRDLHPTERSGAVRLLSLLAREQISLTPDIAALLTGEFMGDDKPVSSMLNNPPRRATSCQAC